MYLTHMMSYKHNWDSIKLHIWIIGYFLHLLLLCALHEIRGCDGFFPPSFHQCTRVSDTHKAQNKYVFNESIFTWKRLCYYSAMVPRPALLFSLHPKPSSATVSIRWKIQPMVLTCPPIQWNSGRPSVGGGWRREVEGKLKGASLLHRHYLLNSS